MKPVKMRKKFLAQCKVIAVGDAVIDYAELKKLLNDSRKFFSHYNDEDGPRFGNTNDRRKSLFVLLAIALTLRRYFDAPKGSQNPWLKKLLLVFKVKPSRKGSNPSLEIVRLCIPNLHRRQQSRYAKAVEKALEEDLSPRKFFLILRPRGGNRANKKKRSRNGIGLTAFIGY